MSGKARTGAAGVADQSGSGLSRPAPLLSDLKRIIPVWLVLVAGTLGVLWLMNTSGARPLVHLAYTSPSAWDLAQVYREDGTNGWRRCLELLNQRRGSQVRLDSAVGILKGNAVLEKARQDLLRSREFMDTFEDVPGMLADLALWEGNVGLSYAWRGDHAAFSNRWEQALAAYDIAYATGEKTAQVKEGRLESLVRLGRWDEATSFTLRLNSEGFESCRYYRQVAEICRKKGDARGEEAALRKALEFSPYDLRAMTDLATLLMRQKRTEEAYNLCAKATSHYRGSAGLWHQQAMLAKELNRPEEAIRCYKLALKLQPNTFVLHYELAQYYLKLGRTHEAQPPLTRAFELNPSFFAQKTDKGAKP